MKLQTAFGFAMSLATLAIVAHSIGYSGYGFNCNEPQYHIEYRDLVCFKCDYFWEFSPLGGFCIRFGQECTHPKAMLPTRSSLVAKLPITWCGWRYLIAHAIILMLPLLLFFFMFCQHFWPEYFGAFHMVMLTAFTLMVFLLIYMILVWSKCNELYPYGDAETLESAALHRDCLTDARPPIGPPNNGFIWMFYGHVIAIVAMIFALLFQAAMERHRVRLLFSVETPAMQQWVYSITGTSTALFVLLAALTATPDQEIATTAPIKQEPGAAPST